MIKYLFFLKGTLPKLFLLATLVITQILVAQIPDNSRLIQINTVKGSMIKLVETTSQYIYHVGSANSEVGFASTPYNNIGTDDLYVLKSDLATGNDLWAKTYDAGAKGTISPKAIYVDENEDLFIFGQFWGQITAGSTTVTAASTGNSFLLKLDSSGNALWVKSFTLIDPSMATNAKFTSDNTDVFMIYNRSNLVRLNTTDGAVIFDNSYSYGVDLRSLALKDSQLYVAGFVESPFATFGSKTITGPNKGFIIKGDKDAIFSASMQTTGSTEASDVSDIAFAKDGGLLFSGFSINSTNLTTETGNKTYTFNPNSTFEANRVYYYIAKIDDNLSSISFFRTSSPISSDVSYGLSANGSSGISRFSSEITPSPNTNSFKTILNVIDRSGLQNNFTHPNETLSPYSHPTDATFSTIVSCDSEGSYDNGDQTFRYNQKLTVTEDYYSSTNLAIRLFKTEVYNSEGFQLWNKSKFTSVGGSLTKQFAQHLNSAKSELFFSSIAEGKVDFFGTAVNNPEGFYTRYLTRLAIDGLPKWKAYFENISNTDELNISNDFACVDKDDNFLFLAHIDQTLARFYDSDNYMIEFTQPAGYSMKVLIKLDKNGQLIWSKKMPGSFEKNDSKAAIITDALGEVYLMGDVLNHGLSMDGYTFNQGLFFTKLNGATGSVIYAKSYPGISSSYSLIPVFDSNNNLYVFSESYSPFGGNYNLDGVSIPSNFETNLDHLMFKFNAAGNIIWGKNFYANAPANFYTYSWPNDVVFDGQNFIMMGNLHTEKNSDFVGLDFVSIPRKYPNTYYTPFIAKITTDGIPLWQLPLHANIANTGNYTNIAMDDQKNMYMYHFVKDKLNINNTEYVFDAIKGDKIIQKFDTNGQLKYSIPVDKYMNKTTFIDIMGEDKINVLGATSESQLLNYPIRNNAKSNIYVATFGSLDENYMTPTKNYLELETLSILNESTPNQFSFDLINNIDWTIISDQNWLNLSYINQGGKNPQNTISGNGDAKITMTADQNNTGSLRSANVICSGDGVAAKTIIVTQEKLLGAAENNISVITMYPNPTSDYLNIKSDKKITNVQIFDMTGKKIISSKINEGKIDVTKLPKGAYLINLTTDTGVVNSKFIKN